MAGKYINILNIIGKDAYLDTILSEIRGLDNPIDFSRIIPIVTKKEIVSSFITANRTYTSAWGTIGNSIEAQITNRRGSTVSLKFFTEGGSPIKVIKRLIEKYPVAAWTFASVDIDGNRFGYISSIEGESKDEWWYDNSNEEQMLNPSAVKTAIYIASGGMVY